MGIKINNGYGRITCDDIGCLNRTNELYLDSDTAEGAASSEEATNALMKEHAKAEGWECSSDGSFHCPTHASWSQFRGATFNLSRTLVKIANYEGAQGLFAVQRRAWMNCVRCKMNAGDGAQQSWQKCIDEYQKSGNNADWANKQLEASGKKTVKTASSGEGCQAQMGTYWARIQKYQKQGLSAGQAVMRAIADCAKDGAGIPKEEHNGKPSYASTKQGVEKQAGWFGNKNITSPNLPPQPTANPANIATYEKRVKSVYPNARSIGWGGSYAIFLKQDDRSTFADGSSLKRLGKWLSKR